MANDDYVTWMGELSVILFYIPKVTFLGEIAKNCSKLPYINLNFLYWSRLLVLWHTKGDIGYVLVQIIRAVKNIMQIDPWTE